MTNPDGERGVSEEVAHEVRGGKPMAKEEFTRWQEEIDRMTPEQQEELLKKLGSEVETKEEKCPRLGELRDATKTIEEGLTALGLFLGKDAVFRRTVVSDNNELGKRKLGEILDSLKDDGELGMAFKKIYDAMSTVTGIRDNTLRRNQRGY